MISKIISKIISKAISKVIEIRVKIGAVSAGKMQYAPIFICSRQLKSSKEKVAEPPSSNENIVEEEVE